MILEVKREESDAKVGNNEMWVEDKGFMPQLVFFKFHNNNSKPTELFFLLLLFSLLSSLYMSSYPHMCYEAGAITEYI